MSEQTPTAKQETIKQHLNIPQLMYQIVQPAVGVCIWGRRTGKTEGPIADFTINNIFSMPGANGFMLGKTYTQLLTRTIPPLIAGWKRYGYEEGKHYWIKKYAPEHLRIPKAYKHPVDPQHYIQWYNGSGIYLFSQDRPGTVNGLEAQWGFGDEARFLDRQRMTEDLIQIMTGRAEQYDQLSNYLSLLWCSDMPRTSKGKWLLEYKNLVDHHAIQRIFEIHGQLVKLRRRYDSTTPKQKEVLKPKIARYYSYLNEYRKGLVYVSLASTLDNIHVLGMNPIKNYLRELSVTDFDLTVLNKEILKLENGFYALLDEDVHGYDHFNYDHIEGLKWNFRKPSDQDCRWDGDIDRTQPLTIACDHNNAINSIGTAQEIGNEFRLLSSKYVLNPLLLPDMVELWHRYYQHHPVKQVNYIHDSTSISGGRNAMSDISFADEMRKELTKRGWDVNVIDIGQIGTHHSRHFFWGKLLQGKDARLPRFRFNKSNAKDWFASAQQAPVIKIGDQIKKDKRSERDKDIPPNEATHISEAVDILVWGMLRERIGNDSDFIGNLYSA